MNDIIMKKLDLRELKFDKKSYSNSSCGCYLKASNKIDGVRYYYKISNYDSYRGVFGFESINEVIVSRLLDCLNIEHLQYNLVNAIVNIDGEEIETYLCMSKEYKKNDERAMSFENYYVNMREKNESPIDFIKKLGFTNYLDDLFFVDYLIYNRDRHGANVEVIINKKNEVRLSPLFDHGLSLILNDLDNKKYVLEYDIFKSEPANNFFGTRSTFENLKFISDINKYKKIKIGEKDFRYIFDGIDSLLPKFTIKIIKKMIKERLKLWKSL